MTRDELTSLANNELEALAREKGIACESSASREELVETILASVSAGGFSKAEKRVLQELRAAHTQAATTTESLGSSGMSAHDNVVLDQIKPETGLESSVYEVPVGYGDNRITLMVIDPYWAYAYWEVPDWKRNEIKNQFGQNVWEEGRLLLRLYDITGIQFTGFNAHSQIDIGVNGYVNNWYLNIPSNDRSYCADIALITKDNYYILLARSNTINVPRDSVSDIIDEEWMSVGDEYEKIYGGLLKGRKVIFPGASQGVEEFSEEMQRKLHLEMEEELFSAIGPFASVPGSAGVVKFQEAKKKGFWLVVDCELIVYGATEPDAKLTVQGRAVNLRPDGTFTLRFALPNGEQVIPVKAVSADGDDERTITPIVSRQTV